MTLKNFTDSIHYEVAELIDIPFTQRLEPIMQAAYDLSPKEFRTSKPLLGFIPWGSSLEEILFGAINEAGLKDDFNLKEKTKLLNEDTPSQNLSDAIYDAKFWAKEFDKAHEAQKLSEEFLAKNEKDWETKTPDEKQKLLEEYAIQLGEIYGEGKKGTPIVTSVMWSSQDTDSRAGKMKNAWGYTYSFDNPRTGVIFIKDTYGINDPVSNDIHHALNTVTHEARHQYQSAAFDDPSGYGTPADISTDWQDWSKNYWVRPMEIDARAMSAYVTI